MVGCCWVVDWWSYEEPQVGDVVNVEVKIILGWPKGLLKPEYDGPQLCSRLLHPCAHV